MQQMVIGVSSLCVLAAICDQILKGSRFSGVMRMVLGLEIARTLFMVLGGIVQGMAEWS